MQSQNQHERSNLCTQGTEHLDKYLTGRKGKSNVFFSTQHHQSADF